MYGRNNSPAIELSTLRLTRLRVVALAGLFLAVALGVSFQQYGGAKDLVLPSGGFVGGDFLAFYTAASAARDGDAARTYEPEFFEAKLHEFGPPKDRFGLTWQYPPTYFLIVAPFALLAYAPAYVLWVVATGAAWLATLRLAGLRDAFVFVVVACPPAFHAVITGQNGFLTAALLAIAALFADRRPVVAGLAAALLTVKPQLGVLLPIAYIAAGCWRAFAVAAAGALLLAAASFWAFGAETWRAMLDGFASTSDNLAAGLLPLYKMMTPFAAARLAGLPTAAAAGVHIAFASAAIVFVALVWRRVRDAELRAAALLASVFFVAPYGYYYEAIILAVPAALVARRGLATGWLRYEQLALVAAFILPLMTPGEPRRIGVAYGFFVSAWIFALVARRIAHEHPDVLSIARRRNASSASGGTA